MRRKVPGAGPAMWWTLGESASPVFLFSGLQGAGEACPYSPNSCSELGCGPLQRKKEYLSGRGSEDLSELQEGGAGSVGRDLVADVGGGTSGELGLPW